MPPPSRILLYSPERTDGLAVVYDAHSFDCSGSSVAEARAAFDDLVAKLLAMGVERVDPRPPVEWTTRVRGKTVRHFVGYREFVAVRLVGFANS